MCAAIRDTYIHTYTHTHIYIHIYIQKYIYTHTYIYHTDTEGCAPRKSLELGHLWSYQTQHMCRRLANTHHTSCRTQTTPHSSERGSGISFTRPTPARSISLTTRHYLLLVKCSRRVICRLNCGTHGPLHTHLSVRQWHQHQLHATDACAQHQPRDAPPCSDRDERPRRLRAWQRHQLHATDACALFKHRASPPPSSA